MTGDSMTGAVLRLPPAGRIDWGPVLARGGRWSALVRAGSTPETVKERPEQTGKKTKRKAKKPRAGRKPAPVVVHDPPTRQIRRQNERRAGKMPVGESQENWHRLMGLQVTRGMQAASRR